MRIAKILFAVLAAVVVLIVAGIAIVAATFDPNDYKGLVTEQVAARTGRTLTIDQDLRLAYFPWLAVETGGITIGSGADFGGAAVPFATVETVAARVKLMPLLERRIEIGTVELSGLTLNLARDAELRGNWQDLVDAASASSATTPAPSSAAAPTSLAIEGVRVRNGNVYWRENRDELRYSVTGLDLTTGGIGADEPVSFDAALQFKDEISGLTATLAAKAVAQVAPDGSATATDLDLDVTVNTGNGAAPRTLGATAERLAFDRTAQTLNVEGLKTSAAGIEASWQLEGTSLIDNPTVRGNVTFAPAALATVLEQLEMQPPRGVAASELGDVSGSAAFAFVSEPLKIELTAVDTEFLGMHVKGEGTLDAANELVGRVDIAEFAPSPAVRSFLRTAVPPTVDVDAIDKLALATRFDTNLDTGRASLRDLELGVFGATINGTLEAVPGDRGNRFRGSVRTSRFAADAFAKAFAALLPPNLAANELGSIEIDARFDYDTGTDTVSVAPFAAELFGLKASGEITGRNVSQAAAWTGTAKIAQFSPQELLRRFGLPPQPTSDDRAFTRATVDTRYTVTKDRAELTDVALQLDDTKITGNFSVVGFDKPAYRFTLAVDSVNADRYLPPKARDASAGEATAGDIELPQNNTMNLDGTMRIGTLRLAGMLFEDVGSRIVIGNGNATLENARARLYGGEFAGNFQVHAAGNEPGLALDGKASGLQLQPLIEALTGSAANFSGTGNFELDLKGSGRTVIQNVQTAGGNVSFAMRDGAIQGFNLGRTLCAAYNTTQRVAGPPERPKQTDYLAIQGTATVAAGVATSRDLLVRTSFMDVTGSGTLGLVEQQLDYDFDAKLTGKIAIPNCETMEQFIGDALPFDIHGTVTSPTITPDFSKLIQRRVREEVQERLQDRIQDRLRDILR
jgi:uncharacterized protein involved in outer membrane biogenesis